jgi:GPH family glycoside/pentoside/hexuronide:cation symporter
MTDDVQAEGRRHSLWIYFSNALGQFPQSVIGAVQGGFLMVYYETVIGLTATYVFWALTIFTIYNAVCNPFLGYFLDKDRKFTRKYGRRFPWIVIGMAPWTLSVLMIYNVPDIDPTGNPWPVFGWLTLTLFIQTTFGMVVKISIGAIRPELFRTQEERRTFAKFYTPVDILAVVVGMLLPAILVDQFPDQKTGYAVTGIVIATVALVFSILSLPGFHENKEMRERYNAAEELAEPSSFLKTTRDILRLKSFIVFFIFATCYGVAISLIVPNLNYLAKFVLQVDGKTLFIILFLYLGSTLLSLPLWLIYIKRANNNKKVFVVAGLLYSASLVPLTFFNGFPDLLVFTSILGFANGGISAFTSTILFPMVIDDFVVKTGSPHKAALIGFFYLLMRLTATIDEGLFALVHNATGFVEGKETYAEMAAAVPDGNMVPIVIGIRLLMGVIPALILLAGTLVFWLFFPLTHEKVLENKKKMEELNL